MLRSAVAALSLMLAPPALAEPKVALERVAEGLAAPIQVAAAPGGRLFVVDQVGVVREMTEDGLAAEPWLDLRPRLAELLPAFDERGLWTLAFHPEFEANGRVFATFAAARREASPYEGSTAHTWTLSEFRADPAAEAVDAGTERRLLEIDWINRKHNGGGMVFGADGFLYLGVGDGGGVHGAPEVYIAPPIDENAMKIAGETMEDPYRLPQEFHHYDAWAQDLSRLHGKILRLDVDAATAAGRAYAIPPGNPFAGREVGRDEIWAWGIRNPFRLSVDRGGAGDLFVSGAGESLWETIHMVAGPGNLGWAVREGAHCFERARSFDPPKDCPRFDAMGYRMRDPVVEYANWSVTRPWSRVEAPPVGSAAVGGVLYRGSAIPELWGTLVFGDFSERLETPSGQLFVARPPEDWSGLWPFERLALIERRLHSLGEDAAGEIYLLTTAQGIAVGETGEVWKLAPAE